MARNTYSEIYHKINELKNPFDIYNDNRAYFGFEIAKDDLKMMIVETEIHNAKEIKNNG